MTKRVGWFGRLNDHFHTHPKGRSHEFAFWFGFGALLLVFAYYSWRLGWFADWGALLTAVIALCFMGWAFLPRATTRAPPPLPKGKRGEIAQRVRASKAERKNKGGVPPPPPIRRG